MTRLPEVPVKAVLVSGEYPRLISALQRLGITTISTKRDFRLPEPVSWHPDMQVCLLKEICFAGLSYKRNPVASWATRPRNRKITWQMVSTRCIMQCVGMGQLCYGKS